MNTSGQCSEVAGAHNAGFHTTQWSVVLQAGTSESTDAHAALAKLCQTYWYPLYVFVRRKGHSAQDAQDLVQAFFLQVLQKGYFLDADPAKGKFRSFLLLALNRFLANEWDRVNRLKRGGGCEIISLDAQDTEHRYLCGTSDEMSPDKAFERQWAMTLLEEALKRLEAECRSEDKAEMFEELKVFLSGERQADSYAQIGQRLGLTEGSVKVTVHRLRRRYRELLREEIAQTVSQPELLEEEMRNLLAALS